MRIIFHSLIMMIWSFGFVQAQDYFTLPKNVWRLSIENEFSSGQWSTTNGKEGVPDEFFDLQGYGLRYYDHKNQDSKRDLYNLHQQYVTITDRADEVIADFQIKDSAIAWGDTLLDFSQNFFGPDPVNMGGYITNSERSLSSSLSRIRIEYGVSEKVTMSISIPNYSKVEETNVWGWRSGSMENFDLGGFIAYHQANKMKFDDFFASEFADSLGSYMLNRLRAVYDSFYTDGGQFSILWAMEQDPDPISKSLTGAQFNPFSNSEKDPTNIDSLMQYFHPNRTASGIGDFQVGFNFQLFGSPVWEGESAYSIYGGLGVTIPTARLISKYDPLSLDNSERPKQFKELQLGEGIAALKFMLFGEFYRPIRGRNVKVTWSSRFKLNPATQFWTRVSPRGTFSVVSDTILNQIGESYRMRRGNEFLGSIVGTLELIPDKIAFYTGQIWYLKGRDLFYSRSKKWNEWMAGGTEYREKYDTQGFAVIQSIGFFLMNTNTMNKYGSIPFEVKLSIEAPVLVRHNWSNFKFNLSFVTFFQFW